MEAQESPGIGKIALKYGLIQGAIAFVLFLIVSISGITQTWLSSLLNIIALIVLLVLAHREFKRGHENMMTYGQGVGSGTLLSVVSAVLTSILLYVYVAYINTGYPAAALQIQRTALEHRGVTGPQLDQALAMTSAMLTPVGMVITGLIGGVIVGFVVALIVSIFTRKDDPRVVI